MNRAQLMSLFASLVGCAPPAPVPLGTVAGRQISVREAVFSTENRPDTPAITIVVSDTEGLCDRLLTPDLRRRDVLVVKLTRWHKWVNWNPMENNLISFADEDLLRDDRYLTPPDVAEEGAASYASASVFSVPADCPYPEKDLAVASVVSGGEVQVSNSSDSTIDVSLSLPFADGSRLTGQFQATHCDFGHVWASPTLTTISRSVDMRLCPSE